MKVQVDAKAAKAPTKSLKETPLETDAALETDTDEPPVVEAERTADGGENEVHVTAPMDLMEGYLLDVTVNDEPNSVRVPEGGVAKGQSFRAALVGRGSIPRGEWRDELFECFQFGLHPVFCLGCFCKPILLGQVMERLRLGCCGGPGPRKGACLFVTTLFVLHLVLQFSLEIVMVQKSCARGRIGVFGTNDYVECPDGSIVSTEEYEIFSTVKLILWCFWLLFILLLTCRARYATRQKFDIPAIVAPDVCGGMGEDLCCACFCSCCTVQQIARHTNDYTEMDDVGCCTKDCLNARGQPEHVPYIV